MPAGPRPPARPGAGPGRNRSRGRPGARPASASTPRSPASPVLDDPAPTSGPTAAARWSRVRSTVTTRAIALVVVLLVLVISYASSLRIYFSQAHEIAASRTEIAERQQRISTLEDELARWSNPDHVRTEARSQLGWVVPGETGYQVVGEDGQPLGGGAEIEGTTAPIGAPEDAWWGQLWGSVQAADEPAPAKKREKTITAKTKPADGPR